MLYRSGELLLSAVDHVRLLIINQSHVAQVEADEVPDLFEVLISE